MWISFGPQCGQVDCKSHYRGVGEKGTVHRAVGDRGGQHCVILAKLDLASPQNPFPEVVLGQKSHGTLEVEGKQPLLSQGGRDLTCTRQPRKGLQIPPVPPPSVPTQPFSATISSAHLRQPGPSPDVCLPSTLMQPVLPEAFLLTVQGR